MCTCWLGAGSRGSFRRLWFLRPRAPLSVRVSCVYLLRWALVGVVLTAGVLAYALAVGAPVLGVVYLLSLPVLLVVVMVVIVLLRARD